MTNNKPTNASAKREPDVDASEHAEMVEKASGQVDGAEAAISALDEAKAVECGSGGAGVGEKR